MGIALFTFSALFAPLHAQWLALLSGLSLRAPVRVARPTVAPRMAPPMRPSRVARPLRVLRVVEPQTPASCAGRMVISGRMADVCAELDRLAAIEASLDQAVAPAR